MSLGEFWAGMVRALLPFPSIEKAFYAETQWENELPEIYVQYKQLLGIAAAIVKLPHGVPDYDTNQFKRVNRLNVQTKIIMGLTEVAFTYTELQDKICQAGHLFREQRSLTQSKKERKGWGDS